MVRAADTAIGSVNDLNGRKVCTVKGSTSYENLVAAAPHALVTLLATYSGCAKLRKGDDAFRAYLNGRLATIEADGDWTLAESYALQGVQGFTPPPIANEPGRP